VAKRKKEGYDKHEILWKIFDKKFKGDVNSQREIEIYFDDIKSAARQLSQTLPVSISNFVLDLCRKNAGISKRVPENVRDAGYDLKKATGNSKRSHGKRLAGTFIYVGLGNEIQSWLEWPNPDIKLIVDSSTLPGPVRRLIRRDEAAMFSILDYLDVLSKVFLLPDRGIQRLQAPMKWQPNEIDGLYFSSDGKELILYPIEAKALTTKDLINLEQLVGGYRVVLERMRPASTMYEVKVVQVAAQMIENGIRFALFPADIAPTKTIVPRCVEITFSPTIEAWTD
jgi:hypothetical protein